MLYFCIMQIEQFGKDEMHIGNMILFNGGVLISKMFDAVPEEL